MKKQAKQFIATILSWQVRRLRNKNNFKIIAVVGSYGKTSTKLAIAQALQHKQRVQYQHGNYNDIVTIPLVIFGQTLPSLFNPLAWMRTFIKNEAIIRNTYPFDVVVVELGTDGPGQIAQFAKYLHVDFAVVTAVAPEHMEFFKSLDAVAAEELAVSKFSSVVLVNSDLVDSSYMGMVEHNGLQSYGLVSGNYKATYTKGSLSIQLNNQTIANIDANLPSRAQQYSALAALTVCHQLLGMNQEEMQAAIKNIQPVAGRMQVLQGIKGSTIIDDTYNASPDAMISALDTLQSMNAPQKIALLGNMNELGEFSQKAHTAVGEHCDASKVNLVITLGPDANTWLADAAEKKGCKVIRTNSPYEVADLIKQHLQKGAVILAKGSQNNVYAEEAIKQLLANESDAAKLVRQSPNWLKVKSKNFKNYNQQ